MDLSGARVLLADDMRINQEIFRELAAPWQFMLDFVCNGKEAVEAAARTEYQADFSGSEDAGTKRR